LIIISRPYLNEAETKAIHITEDGNYHLILCEPGVPFRRDTTKTRADFIKRFDNGYAHVRVYKVTPQ
jgi:hypothetical protein